MTQPEETPVSFIPSNFIEKGKILNGTFDIRNAIESHCSFPGNRYPCFPPAAVPDCPHHHSLHDRTSSGNGSPDWNRRGEHHCLFDECPAFCSEPQGNLEVRQSSGRKATQETTFQRAKDKETPESRKNGRAFQSNGIGSPTV